MRKRNRSITVRLSDEEYVKLQDLIQKSGQSAQSYFIGATINGRITSAAEIAEIKHRNLLLADMDKQLRGIGTNLNQMAHIANESGQLPSSEKLEEMSDKISSIRTEVNREWLSIRQSISQQKHTQP